MAGNNRPEQTRPARSGAFLAFFALLLAAAALAGTAWMWWQEQASPGGDEQRVEAEISRLESSDNQLSLELNQVRDQVKALAAADEGTQIAAMQQRLLSDSSKTDRMESTLNEQASVMRSLQAATESVHGRLTAAEAALSGLSARELDAATELDLEEVDYLLRLANERLKLFSDPVAADQALEVADLHLAALDNPVYLGVRQDIAAARRALAAVSIPDYPGISGRLEAIQQEITTLPFRQDAPSIDQPGQAPGDGWWDKLKGAFSNLVTVRRSTEEENRKITLQDKDFIRQSAWLQLEVAQLALMRREQQAFEASLARVKESLVGWFDTGDKQYRAILQSIDELAATGIQVKVPDITAPWSTLRLIRAGAPRPTATPGIEQPAAPARAAPGEESAPEAERG